MAGRYYRQQAQGDGRRPGRLLLSCVRLAAPLPRLRSAACVRAARVMCAGLVVAEARGLPAALVALGSRMILATFYAFKTITRLAFRSTTFWVAIAEALATIFAEILAAGLPLVAALKLCRAAGMPFSLVVAFTLVLARPMVLAARVVRPGRGPGLADPIRRIRSIVVQYRVSAPFGTPPWPLG